MANPNPGDAPASGGPVAAELTSDLAAASRILVAQGVVDAFGHVSMRHPRAPERYLMARSAAPALATPEDIRGNDLARNPCTATGRSSSRSPFIHAAIDRVAPAGTASPHTHSTS